MSKTNYSSNTVFVLKSGYMAAYTSTPQRGTCIYDLSTKSSRLQRDSQLDNVASGNISNKASIVSSVKGLSINS